MITKENVHITNLLVPAAQSSESLSPMERLESILRDREYVDSPPGSLANAWNKFDSISRQIETRSEKILDEFFSCKKEQSLTSLAGSLLTCAKDNPVMLSAVRAFISRLSELANSLNRLHESRILAGKFSDVFMLFRVVQICEKKLRGKYIECFLIFLKYGKKVTEKLILEKVIAGSPGSGKAMMGKVPPLPNSPKLGPKIVPKIAPPLPSFPVGKASPAKVPVPPPPVGKVISPVIPGKIPPLIRVKAPIPSPSVSEIFTAPVFPTPKMEPGVEYRKIHWQSIPVSRFEKSIFNQKIFGKKFEQNIDFEKIKNHFVREKICKTPIKSREPPTAAGTPVIGACSPGSTPICLPSVLDQKRIQQIEIFLNRYRTLNRTFLESLVREGKSGEESLVDLLEAIVALFPSQEETELLKLSHEKSLAEQTPLPKADAFLADLAIVIPEFKIGASARIMLATFDDSYNELANYLKIFNKKIGDIVRSETLVEIFRITGSIVVFLGTSNSFNGFSLDNLLSLKKIISFQQKDFSALHCVVEMMTESQYCDVVSLIDHAVTELLEWDFEEVLLEVTELEKAIKNRLGKIEFKAREFFAEMIVEIRQFIDRVSPLLAQLVDEKNQAKENAKLVREYFAENEKKSMNEIFSSLKLLKNDLGNAKTKSKKIREK